MKYWAKIFACLWILSICSVSCVAEEQVSVAEQKQTDVNSIESFFDIHVPSVMQRSKIPGLVIAVVKDDEVILRKGYGYANLKDKISMTPDTTVMRIGSVTKLFTSIAIMQLVEQELIQLDSVVREYLPEVTIINPFKTQVQLIHLLTHTTGFLDSNSGIFTYHKSKKIPLKEFLENTVYLVAYPPGLLQAYSNFSMALAGLIVETISQTSYDEYIQQNIFHPLEMNHSSFEYVEDNATTLATGYMVANNVYAPLKFDYFNLDPAGSVLTTADDMTHFLKACIAKGFYKDKRILQESTFEKMYTKQFSHDKRFTTSIGLGFFEFMLAGHRVYFHNGGLRGFGSWLYIVPEENIGIFISYNQFDFQINAGNELLYLFLNQYYPKQKQEPVVEVVSESLPDFLERAKDYKGDYIWYKSGCNLRTFEKIFILLGLIRVEVDKVNKSLKVWFPGQLQPIECREIEPYVFQRLDYPDSYIVFKQDEQGKTKYMCLDALASGKAPWHINGFLHFGIMSIFLLVFCITLLLWPIQFMIQKLKKKKIDTPKSIRAFRPIAWCVSLLSLAFSLLTPYFFLTKAVVGPGGIPEYFFQMPYEMQILKFLPIIITLLTLIMWRASFIVWKSRAWSIAQRIYYTLVSCTATAFLCYLTYWNVFFM